jgi:hypothetical protein
MAEEIVRCPYCVLDDHVFPMLLRPGGWFVCQKCGHTAIPQRNQISNASVKSAES